MGFWEQKRKELHQRRGWVVQHALLFSETQRLAKSSPGEGADEAFPNTLPLLGNRGINRRRDEARACTRGAFLDPTTNHADHARR